MPKIQVFVSDEVLEILQQRVENKRSESGEKNSANMSSEAAKLITLGLKAEKYQSSKQSSSFDEQSFFKELLKQVVTTNYVAQQILGVTSFNEEIQGKEKLTFENMVKVILSRRNEVVNKYFISDEE